MGCFSGPKTTTTNTNTGQQSSSQQYNQQSSVTPNLPDWLMQYYQGQPGQINQYLGQLRSQIGQPLYGPQQQAQYQQDLNSQLSQAQQNISSQLARSGALNSARSGVDATQLALGGAQQLGNYLAQVPLMNRQFQQGALGQYGAGLANAMNYRPPVIGQSTSASGTGASSGQSSSYGQQVSQQSGGILQGLLGSLLGGVGSMLTGGLGGLLGGQGFGKGASAAMGAGGGGYKGGGSGFTPYNQGSSWNSQIPGYQGGPSIFPPVSIPEAPAAPGYQIPGMPAGIGMGLPPGMGANPYTGMGSQNYNPYNPFGVQ